MRAFLQTAIIGLLCMTIVGCGGPGSADDTNTLHRGLNTDPESLDPQRARSVQAADVLRDIGEGLVGYSADGRVVPAAASEWSVSDDALEYTFRIRGDARWSNGEALTAEHFVTGLRRLVDPDVAAFYASTVADIEGAAEIIAGDRPTTDLGVEAIDERTLVIRLTKPVPYLLSLLTHGSTFPAYSEQGNETADGWISNGAYVLESRSLGSLIVLRRNEHYWNNAATAIDRVYHHIVTEEATELSRYRAGELHITGNVPPENFQETREQFGDQLRIAPYLGTYYYGFNLTKPPFKDNRELRQALSMAIDRDVIVESLTGRGEIAAYSFVPPGTDNYEPPQLSYANLSQDERNGIARQLIKEAGYGPDNPLTVELRYNTAESQRRIAVAIQSMWRETLGVETELVGEEFRILLANIRDRLVTEVFRASWIGDFNDAQNFLGLMVGDGPSNMPGYSNAEYDSLIERAAGQADLHRRRLYFEEAERVLLADHAIIPLYFYVSKHLVSPKVIGWQDNVLDYHYSQHLSLDPAK